ncbi:MAG: hypothetical protein Q8R28_01235 [Dehalococcoidia bacterium]|nr:hypothetical protein [Dehalococcoidia bacterium]
MRTTTNFHCACCGLFHPNRSFGMWIAGWMVCAGCKRSGARSGILTGQAGGQRGTVKCSACLYTMRGASFTPVAVVNHGSVLNGRRIFAMGRR